ncbi:MAG: glutamate--tRNA ligase [Deltaproteobacteria bacterium]|nr:glutamate--tRNA ligase [Deltaproteobacteria bacterium]
MSERPPVVRIAPSPTGDPHVGTAYIALFNYAFTKQRGGKFLLRIEDTDRARSTRQSEDMILASLKWLGITWDEGPDVGGPNGPYRQSERLDIYKTHVDQLVASGKAYWCTCTAERLDVVRKEQSARKENPGYDGRCRFRDPKEVAADIAAGTPGVVRLKIPRGSGDPKAGADASSSPEIVFFMDKLRGRVEFNTKEVDDQVLQKSDGFPTYHLANVVDDHLMGVTHVFRGEEWISSTPKHVLLYGAFGWEAPEFGHLSLLRNADKSKVSKRKNPVSLSWFKESGYLPDALVNYLGQMAFTFEDGREIFSLQDFVQHFTFDRVSLNGPVFDLKKLLWLNGRYLREKRSDDEVVQYLKDRLFTDDYLLQIVKIAKERFEKSEDFIGYAPWFFTASPYVEGGGTGADLMFPGKTKKEVLAVWDALVETVDVTQDFSHAKVDAVLKAWCESNALSPKEAFMPLRLMLTGKKATPGLPESMAVLGRERVRTRMRAALELIKKLPEAKPEPKAEVAPATSPAKPAVTPQS